MIGSIVKALEILEMFRPDEPSLSLAEISNRLGYPKTTLHTILNTLELKGYVERGKNGIYSLGTAIIPLTQSVRVNAKIRDRAAPLLRELGDFSKQSVYLAIFDDLMCLYIYAIETKHRLLARTAIGERVLMHYTSVGKSMLAFLPDDLIDALIERYGLPRATEYTIVDRESLREELAIIRSQGYSTDKAEHEPNVYCIGCPIFDADGEVIAACSISGVDMHIVTEHRESLSAAVRYTAQEISRRMGYIPSGNKLIWRSFDNPLRQSN